MKSVSISAGTVDNIGQQQQRFQREEFRSAVRALLMTPLMSPEHDDFPAVRRQAEALRDWFARETGWPLQIEHEGARLYKRPADLASAMRGLPGYDRRRYVLLCLACAVLERADPQITLRLLGERLLQFAAEPALASCGFTFTLGAPHERRELVAVCRTLLEFGRACSVSPATKTPSCMPAATQADALYDVQRRTLAGMLAAVRGPSTFAPEDAPVTLERRLHALVDEHVADSDEGRRTALRHQLARRLLDDPVVYIETLDPEARAYFVNQRGAMAARLCDAAGLVAEQRAEGLALVDEAGALTDVAMPAEGTDAHATLLVAEYLASGLRRQKTDTAGAAQPSPGSSGARYRRLPARRQEPIWPLLAQIGARSPAPSANSQSIAIERLEKLQLIVREADRALPAAGARPFRAWRGRHSATSMKRIARRGHGCRSCSVRHERSPDFVYRTVREAQRLPIPTQRRWQPLRLGLVELFHYDSEEFWFRDGHLLLRGNNGTGKSKVLSLTLPFLLDAQLKPSRIEPDGDSGKKMAWNLLMNSYDRRIGYAWIEFGRLADDGTPHYLTLGAGLSAVAARPQVDSWFFVLEDADDAPRINQGLWLMSDQRVVLTRERLRDALEGRGQVFDTAASYRRAVDERLFHLGAKRYDALMDTLIQLRQPQLSKKPDETALSNALDRSVAAACARTAGRRGRSARPIGGRSPPARGISGAGQSR